MNEPIKRTYDLEQRTLEFSKEIRDFVKVLPRTISNVEYASQLIRSSASVGANYIEANESLGKKDFLMRIKISRKEAKESMYWLELVETNASIPLGNRRKSSLQEASELMNIFGAILRKSV